VRATVSAAPLSRYGDRGPGRLPSPTHFKRLDKRVEAAQEVLVAPLLSADRVELHRLLR
jgi:hypothetical protein